MKTTIYLDLQEVLDEYEITIFFQLLPRSLNDDLLSIYEINCECDIEALYDDLLELDEYWKRMEKVPVNIPLYTPNDYEYELNGGVSVIDFLNGDQAFVITHSDLSITIAGFLIFWI